VAEQPYHVAQIAPQAGTFYVPGASVAAITILPVTSPADIELDRASQYPEEDYGKNIDAHAGRGYHGVRGATLPLEGELTFEQAMHLFEMHYKGAIVPTGTGPYTWLYPFETGLPTLIPYTVETGSETTQDQWEAVGVLIDELTLGFDDLDAPGAHPWTFQASCQAINRVAAALTGSLSSTAVETMQGQWTILKEGSTATAFAALTELAASLVSFQIVTRRSIVLRPYGGTGDTATGYGFSAKSSGEITAKVKISATSKSDIHDAWNSSGAVLGEKRWRVEVDGAGDNLADLDFRFGMTAVPLGERDGERLYEVTGKIVDDTTLSAPAQWTVVNSIADLTP
jgi:hypothetical protein